MKEKQLRSKIIFDSKIADRFQKTDYYFAMDDFVRDQDYIRIEKGKHKTTDKKDVSEIFQEWIDGIRKVYSGYYDILNSIKRKNEIYEFHGGPKPINSDLLSLVGNVGNLLYAYQRIRKNDGAIARTTKVSVQRIKTFDKEQVEFLDDTEGLPDGINMELIHKASKLIMKNRYPWGTSTRVFVDKPGQPTKKRPITFPPFMDKIVQNSLKSVLESIYEPVFEKRNNSFAFRKLKNTKDNLYLLMRPENAPCTMALEGDIKGAYDNVNRERLIQILSKRIHDRQFLDFIRKRLDYEYKAVNSDQYQHDKIGLPQGGIDSPYLWNIYMLEFDDFIVEYTKNLFDKLNRKKRGKWHNTPHIIQSKKRQRNDYKLSVVKNVIKFINSNSKIKSPEEKLSQLKEIYNCKNVKKLTNLRGAKMGLKSLLRDICKIEQQDITLVDIKKNLFEERKKLRHLSRKLGTADINKLQLRFAYTRYADDWILITNANRQILEKIKSNCTTFLKEDLYATLEPTKTLITNLMKEPAKFLGFEIKAQRHRKYKSKQIMPGKLYADPDKQRLIDRLHMKGYCDEKGNPKEISKLTMLEFYAIIERYNAVIRGIVNAYVYSLANPRRAQHVLSRWIYILRFSCLKTLAQKYKTSIRKLYKKYRSKMYKTIETTVRVTINNITYEKTWRLLTLGELIIPLKNSKSQR